jgi:hypothetical protein
LRRDPKKLWPMTELRMRLEHRLGRRHLAITQWSEKQRKSAQVWLERGGQAPGCVKALEMSPYAAGHL